MKHLKLKCLSILFLFAIQPPLGRAQDQHFIIKGKILALDSKKPIEAANIKTLKNNLTTFSNAGGMFLLHLKAKDVKDSIGFSIIGFEPKKLAISQLIDQENTIFLKPSIIELQGVEIKVQNPLNIIKNAIAKIPENYHDTHLQNGFYRTVTAKNNEYIQLSEAVFDIFNPGYASTKGNQLRLTKMRAIKDEKQSHGIDLGLKPSGIFEYDVIKNIDENPILSKNGLKNHTFKLLGIIDYEGQPAYKIGFDQIDELQKSLYKGTIYIHRDNLVFMAIDYGLSPKGIKYARYGDLATRMLLGIMKLEIQIKKDQTYVKYQKVGARWALSNVTNHTSLNFKSERNHYDFLADVKVDYMTTNIDTQRNEPFKTSEVLGDQKFVESQHVDQANLLFWKDYTILLPDFEIEPIIKKIMANNEQYNLKKKAQLLIAKLPKNANLRLDSLISFYQRNNQFNGTVLIVHKGETLISKSYGFANTEQKTLANMDTRYRIGSLAKPFTAILIQQLANEGKLELKAPISRYLPNYRHGEILLEQLLNHTSGIPNYLNNTNYVAKILNKKYKLEELVANFCSDSLAFDPGSQFNYSNSGYVVLALIVQKIEGKPFADVFKSRIFDPAKMESSYLGWDDNTINHAKGYLYDKPEPLYSVENVTGAGGITSTASDLLKWNNALLSGKLLPKPKMEEMYQERSFYEDWNAGYGYGWMIDKGLFNSTKQHQIIYHPGTDFGFYSMFVKQDDTETCIILLNNTGDFPRFDITDLIMDELNKTKR